jgi:hypothetical protein
MIRCPVRRRNRHRAFPVRPYAVLEDLWAGQWYRAIPHRLTLKVVLPFECLIPVIVQVGGACLFRLFWEVTGADLAMFPRQYAPIPDISDLAGRNPSNLGHPVKGDLIILTDLRGELGNRNGMLNRDGVRRRYSAPSDRSG